MFCDSANCVLKLKTMIGQVIALFIVGLGEYGTVWLGTDWDKEIQKGIKRNQEEAKRRSMHNHDASV